MVAAALFVALAAASIFGRSPERERQAERHFTAEQIARGKQFSLERSWWSWSWRFARFALLGWLALSGAGTKLLERAGPFVRTRWWLATLLVGGAVFVAQQLLLFLWSVYGLYHLRAWGYTQRSFGSWLGQHATAVLVSAGVGAALLLGFYALVRISPRRWWLLAGMASAVAAAFWMYAKPVVIAPLYNRFEPLRNTPHAALQPAIEALAAKAGLPVQDVLVMDASRQGSGINAYFSGFFGTRRIVVYDTLLENQTTDQTLSLVAHEMGHWRRNHILRGIALEACGALLGFFLLSRLLERATANGRFGMRSAADPGGVPLLLLLVAVWGFASLPVENAVSRAFEREADQDALELFGHPEAFIAKQKRLALTNLQNLAPSGLEVFLFATHPPVLDRIGMAERYR